MRLTRACIMRMTYETAHRAVSYSVRGDAHGFKFFEIVDHLDMSTIPPLT
jgi:hypothetical protein